MVGGSPTSQFLSTRNSPKALPSVSRIKNVFSYISGRFSAMVSDRFMSYIVPNYFGWFPYAEIYHFPPPNPIIFFRQQAVSPLIDELAGQWFGGMLLFPWGCLYSKPPPPRFPSAAAPTRVPRRGPSPGSHRRRSCCCRPTLASGSRASRPRPLGCRASTPCSAEWMLLPPIA